MNTNTDYPCVQGAVKHLAYLMSAPDVRKEKRDEWRAHVGACPICQARERESLEAAKAQNDPEQER